MQPETAAVSPLDFTPLIYKMGMAKYPTPLLCLFLFLDMIPAAPVTAQGASSSIKECKEMGLGKEQRKKQALTPLLLHHFRLFSQKWLIYGCCSQRGPSPVRNTAAYFPGMMSQEPWQRPKPGASEGGIFTGRLGPSKPGTRLSQSHLLL